MSDFLKRDSINHIIAESRVPSLGASQFQMLAFLDAALPRPGGRVGVAGNTVLWTPVRPAAEGSGGPCFHEFGEELQGKDAKGGDL